MAWEAPIQDLPALVSTNDLSGNQFYLVKLDPANAEQVLLCSAHTDLPIGVLQNKPEAGEAAQVRTDGVTKALAGATVNPGDEVGTDATGRFVTKNNTATGADFGDYVRGICLDGGTVGVLITVKLYGPYRIGAGGTAEP